MKPSQPADSPVDSRVETTPDADLSVNSKLRKTTTIALNPGEEARKGTAELSPAGNMGNQVQYASYQTEAGAPAKPENRIAELEQMVRDFRSQQAHGLKQRSAPVDRSVDSPEPPVKQQTSSRRIRIRTEAPAEIDADMGSEESPMSSDANSSAQSSAVDVPAVEAYRLRHPLSDLDDEDDHPPQKTTKLASRRHFLEDDVDPPSRQPAPTSKVIRASESVPEDTREP